MIIWKMNKKINCLIITCMNVFRSQKQSGLLRVFTVALFMVFECSVSSQTITRAQIHNNAVPFTTYSFTASSGNLKTNVNCSSVGNVNTPSWVVAGHNGVGMPYCWGGFSSLTSFTAGLTNGKSAGDNDCTTNGDCCEGCALGVDCSGFVSHAWGLSTKYSTTTIPNISTAYTSASQVKEGDVFNLSGSHVRLVDTNYVNGSFLLMESSAVDWKVSYRSYTASQLTSYTPRWYVHVDTTGGAAPVCNHYYAILPYSNSFESAWTEDSCNNGLQRAPDKFWKSNVGGTSMSGEDFLHRNDYTGADWTAPTSGQYTPSASNGTYSARFHNSPATAGSTGALDFYLNLSAAGSKTIKFDYIHNESSPSPFAFNVLLSTDGGSTFPTTLLTLTTVQMAAWTTQTISTTAISPTSVLRFLLTDKGSQDVGIDNLVINTTVVTGLPVYSDADQFSLYPNPSDGTMLYGTVPETIQNALDVRIYNMLGSEVVSRQVMADGGKFSLPLERNELSSGIYLFVATSGDRQFRRKIIVN
jgi:hypothetical protein